MTNEEKQEALDALDVLCKRIDGYQTAKDIVRKALSATPRN